MDLEEEILFQKLKRMKKKTEFCRQFYRKKCIAGSGE
jgi:hypothetical protein